MTDQLNEQLAAVEARFERIEHVEGAERLDLIKQALDCIENLRQQTECELERVEHFGWGVDREGGTVREVVEAIGAALHKALVEDGFPPKKLERLLDPATIDRVAAEEEEHRRQHGAEETP